MRKSRFTETQILEVLKEGEAGLPVAEVLRKHGISRQTYFTWKAKYGGAWHGRRFEIVVTRDGLITSASLNDGRDSDP